MTINIENVRKLRDFIDELSDGEFCMSDWSYVHDCKTVACLAGWGAIIFDVPEFDPDVNMPGGDDSATYYINNVGIAKLGLSHDESYRLFVPTHLSRRLRSEALSVLDSLIETGDFEWSENPPRRSYE